jgi:hypothetical protein
MTLTELFQWWNLIFVLPFGAAILQILLQVTGALHLERIGHGFHFGHHAHIESDFHADHSGHAIAREAQTGHAPGPGHHADTGHQLALGSRLINAMASLLGFGEVPLMIVLSSFCLTWGFVGLISNKVLGYILPPEIFIWLAMFVALAVASVSTGLMARGIAKILPSMESYGSREDGFTGKTGKAITQISSTTGSIATFDNYHNRVELKCRTDGDEILPYGSEVVLLYYDEETQRYIVCRTEDFSLRVKSITDSLKHRD